MPESTRSITHAELLNILEIHADAAFEHRDDAERFMRRKERGGGPFGYEIVKLTTDLYAVVNHIKASLYRSLVDGLIERTSHDEV